MISIHFMPIRDGIILKYIYSQEWMELRLSWLSLLRGLVKCQGQDCKGLQGLKWACLGAHCYG